jgi:class 3 adenylate cyclase
MFADIVAFTTHASHIPPSDVVTFLDAVFATFDAICEQHAVTKIKTIGDAYMCFKGDGTEPENTRALASVALGILHAGLTWPDGTPLQVRIGLHSGPVTAGVIGSKRLQYDVWGDTVNVANRMESTGEPGRIHVSEQFALFLGLVPHHVRNDSHTPTAIKERSVIPNEVRNEEHGTWHLALRGETELKGKGLMTTYWLEGATT